MEILPPVEKPQPTISYTLFEIVSVSVVLDTKAIVSYVMYDTDKIHPISLTLVLEGEEYTAWGNDDSYITDKVKEQIQLMNQ